MAKTLLVGYKAADLTPVLLDGDVTCHVLDIYHRHAIEKVHHARTICTPHLPEEPWDLIRFKTGPKLMSGELSLDLLQEIYRLSPGAKLWGSKGTVPQISGTVPAKSGGTVPVVELEFVGKERDRNDLLDKIRNDPDRVRDFSARWKSSVPGGPTLEFTSYPGCFCHRRQDEGGLSLAEVVASELMGTVPNPKGTVPAAKLLNPRGTVPAVKLLDMGCGCGLVGLLVKSVVPSVELTMVDSHSRATEAAELNAHNFGMTAEVILADNGTPERMDGSFDVFVGNPPYYSDYRIADVFLATAARALKSSGVCYTVCKNADGLEPVQKKYFPEVKIIRRRGYAVLKSVKE